MSVRRKLTAVVTAGMLIASSVALGGAMALPAVADDAVTDQAAIETDEQAAASDDAVALAAPQAGALWASVDLYRVTLSEGAVMGTTRGHMSSVTGNVPVTASNIYSVSGTYNDDAATGIDATVVYKLKMQMPDAPEEDTWLKTRLFVEGGSSYAQCEIYQGDPRSGGTPSNIAYTCFPRMTQNFPNVRYTFAVEMNRYVESSGTIDVVGPVSLAQGKYFFDLPFRLPGAESVAGGSSTTFGTVMREPDRPDTTNLALTRFAYRIQDTQTVNGVATAVDSPYWIAGRVSRDRSGNNESTCGVYDVDPGGSTPWRDLKTVAAAPYACSATGGRVDSGHYAATITVSKRDVTVIPATDRPRQTDLYRDVCLVRPNDCDLRLSTIEQRTGETRSITNWWGNRSPHRIPDHKFTFESVSSTKHTFGTEVTLGLEGGIGVKYKAEIKAKYELEIASETKTGDEQEVPIEPGFEARIVGTPNVIHTEGDVLVNQGGRLFLLQAVVADFPIVDGSWHFFPEFQRIAGGGLGGVQNPPMADLDPAAVAAAAAAAESAEASAAAARAASGKGSLARTGVSMDGLIPSLLAAGLALSAGLLLVLRRRRTHPID